MQWLAAAFFGEGHGCCDGLAGVEKSGSVRLKEMWRDAISDGDNEMMLPATRYPRAPRAPPASPPPFMPPPPEPIFAYPVIWTAGKQGRGGGCTLIGQLPPLSPPPPASHPPPSLSAFRATLSPFGLLIIYRII